MAPVRVLVTGAGSGVGNGIVKALRHGTLPLTIFCSDIGPLNVGLYRADEAVIWPKVESPGALEAITKSLKALAIDVVLIGSEFDLAFFAANKDIIEERTGATVVVSPAPVVEISNDKWSTVEFLRQNGLPFAEAVLPSDLKDARSTAGHWGYPVILKSRSGTSSRNVHVIRRKAQLDAVFDSVPDPMIQRLLDVPGDDLNNEYTCSVFKTLDGDLIGPFTARRTLRGGDSWHIEVDDFTELHSLVLEIAGRLPVIGPLNVQLILTGQGPVPFELNARFSGTTAIQAHFGFNAPEMAIRHCHLGQPIDTPDIGKGLVLRYMEEVFLDHMTAKDLTPPLPAGEVHKWF